MNWNDIDSDLWTIAAEECTAIQLRVLELRYRHDMSIRTIAQTIDRDEATVRGHLQRATRKVRRAQEGEAA